LVAVRNKYAKDDFMKTENLLQPLKDLHFTNDYDMFTDRRAHRPTMYGLLAVAGFLLLLGCINFINLTTAQASSRAKEIGVRKTMGSSKTQLIGQFLGETFLLTTLATILSILIAPLLLKMFADFIPADLSFKFWKEPGILLFALLLVIIVSLFSGFYPAWVLTRFNAVAALKNQRSSSNTRGAKVILRKSLTVSQFIIAQFFIIATLLVSKQINFAINKDMGFRKEAVLNIRAPWGSKQKSTRQALLQKIRSIPEIDFVSLGGQTPAAAGYNSTTMKYSDGKSIVESTIEIKVGDSSYFKVYNLPLVAGRSPRDGDSSYAEFAINESFAKLMGLKKPEDAVGKLIEVGSNKVEVVGLLKDFNTKSIHKKIEPLAISNVAQQHFNFHLLLKPKTGNSDQWKSAIAKLENAWKEVYPEEDFSYEFYDEKIAGFYKSEQNMAKLMKWATGLAILISCLGMLGLVIYTTNQRVKEIGVRKVLGASVAQIITLLSKEFISLVLIAFVIAVPVAWWAFSSWLNNFAFKTELSWWIFVIGGLLMLAGALFTLSFQTIKAALANPVKALRSE
jgi:putative ABC transport system permease protein